jgi:hypothetical protein
MRGVVRVTGDNAVNGTYRPVNSVTVQQGGEDRQRWVTIPVSEADDLGIDKGDRLVPTVQDGLLVYVPVGDRDE